MYLALNIICLLFAAVSSVLCVIRTTHMLQLNSYKASVQFKWMRQNFKHYIINIILLVVAVAAAFTNAVWLYIVFYVFAIIFAIANKPMKNAKKPLVYTARVKRMLVTDGIVWLAAFAAAFFGGNERFGLFAMGISLSLIPLLPIIGNAINAPIEKAIRQYYINDAKKMLKACPNLKVIGITGSYGKTSVKYYLSTVLKA